MDRNRQNQAEGEIPGQQPPGNMERPAEADGARQPGGMPEGIDMEEMEALRQEIIVSLAASGILLIAGILIALFFKRRSYVKL